MEPYSSSIEHLRDELARLDLLLRRGVLLARRPEPVTPPHEFRGLVISDPEIDALLREPDLLGARWRRQEERRDPLAEIDRELGRLEQRIAGRRAVSDEAGIRLALPALARSFDLSAAEIDVILVALGPELEPEYETLYAYLQNDVTRKRPSVDLILNLICRSLDERLSARPLLEPRSRLVSHGIVEIATETQDRDAPLLRKFLKLDEVVLSFLLDQPLPSGSGALIDAASVGAGEWLEETILEQLRNLAAGLQLSDETSPVVQLVGGAADELQDAAVVLCEALGRRLLITDLAQVKADPKRLARLKRDAVLSNALPGIVAEEPLERRSDTHEGGGSDSVLWRGLRELHRPFLLLGAADVFGKAPSDVRLWRVPIPSPGFDLRRRRWRAALSGAVESAIDADWLADLFRFSDRRIRQTVDMAKGTAAQRDPRTFEITTQDVLDAARMLTTSQVGRFAVQIEPRYTWSDIVLPAEKTQQLRGIASWMKLRGRVHREWGFGQKLSRGKGLNVLFTGPPGTGKTMAAEILARELSLDLFQIDLSSIVSKYIGETEQNLSAVFREAERSQALLFFDEADALFGKRTEVKDAHDRYANIEVNYLLQRVEQYEGVVVLATNLQRNLDDAFLRRMHEVIDFPFPDGVAREQIWRGHFPDEAPREEAIDYAFLAQQFKLAGGNIKNVVLAAAFLAAQDARPIEMADLIQATKAELQKQGKLCVKSDFGPYYDLIRRPEPADL